MIFLSILFPTVFQSIKLLLFALCLFFGVIYLVKDNVEISQLVLNLIWVYAAAGLLWTIYGLFANNPGAVSMMTVMVAYPLLFSVLVYCYKVDDEKNLHFLILISGMSIGVFDILFIVSELLSAGNFFSTFVFDIYKDDAVIDNNEHYFKFTLPNIASAIFIFPYLIVSYFENTRYKLMTIFALIMLFLVIVLSGRRAGFIAPILGVVMAYILTKKMESIINNRIFSRILIWLIVIILIFCIVFINFNGADFYFGLIKSIFDFSENQSNLERLLQFKSLLNGIDHSPIIGSGAGAAADYSRSDEQPWAYELTYIAFIFQYGFIGFFLYYLGVISLIYVLIDGANNKLESNFELPFLAGFLSFMIANATNPYLAKFDYMWIIFIPVALLNSKMLEIKIAENN